MKLFWFEWHETLTCCVSFSSKRIPATSLAKMGLPHVCPLLSLLKDARSLVISLTTYTRLAEISIDFLLHRNKASDVLIND